MQVLAWLSFVIGWWRGGRTERFAVAVLFCDYAFTRLTTGMAGAHQMVAVAELVVTLIFVWMAFTSDRWWTLVTSAARLFGVADAPRLEHINISLYLWRPFPRPGVRLVPIVLPVHL